METNARELRADEPSILRRASRGDPEAARLLLDEHLPIVYGFVFARVGGNNAVAEDIMQETLTEGLKSADSFRGDSRLSTWLCTIARRRIARHYEKERKQELAASRLRLVQEPATEPDERDRVIAALGTLSALHRQVLVMKYLDGDTVDEIAATLGKTNTQVQSLLQRARVGIKQSLESFDG